MPDIFISYSKIDHALALKLSTFLEAEGWSVWWDKSLAAADLYRDEIMKQLVAARAVITIWTPNSIKSDWVRAEAGAAKKEGKLIPVKTSDVEYADIPLPFGEMHTENVGSTELIRAAVVAQLAKPAVEPSTWGSLTKGFKYEVLTWFGIVGGALTLFTNLSAVLKVADWARLLVQSWKEWTHAFWVWAFGWLGIHLPPEWTPVLSFLLFWSLLTIGQAIKFKTMVKDQTNANQETSFRLKSWRTPFYFVVLLVIGFAVVISVALLSFFVEPLPESEPSETTKWFVQAAISLTPSVAVVTLFAKQRLHAVLSVLFINIFLIIITIKPLEGSGSSSAFSAVLAMSWILPMFLLSVAPAKSISRRLLFLAIGLLLLIALNELSKFGLDVTAPKLQG